MGCTVLTPDACHACYIVAPGGYLAVLQQIPSQSQFHEKFNYVNFAKFFYMKTILYLFCRARNAKHTYSTNNEFGSENWMEPNMVSHGQIRTNPQFEMQENGSKQNLLEQNEVLYQRVVNKMRVCIREVNKIKFLNSQLPS